MNPSPRAAQKWTILMDLNELSQKHLNDMERQITELLSTMQKAKYDDPDLIAALKKLEQDLGNARRARFDADDSQYRSY